ncbi:hypothetical protein C8F04DRAFT_1388817 [Mycena alexandri]|uniref:Uncharacterized protein n=1 Tax=Mycena alexandri TaxID=1745969 RepID=A0AAD6THC9_9AGAR|nr:hypothetical protein C8F04DRAFT_1388817 [Mycena alexandri]
MLEICGKCGALYDLSPNHLVFPLKYKQKYEILDGDAPGELAIHKKKNKLYISSRGAPGARCGQHAGKDCEQRTVKYPTHGGEKCLQHVIREAELWDLVEPVVPGPTFSKVTKPIMSSAQTQTFTSRTVTVPTSSTPSASSPRRTSLRERCGFTLSLSFAPAPLDPRKRNGVVSIDLSALAEAPVDANAHRAGYFV